MARSKRPGRRLCLSSSEHIIGDRLSATKPDTTTAPASASANSANSRPVRPGVKASGAYTATSVRAMATMAKPIARAPEGGGTWIAPLLDVPVDVLQHHDGVIDHQPDGQHQGQQRERVDGKA